jgi:alpha-glucosidase
LRDGVNASKDATDYKKENITLSAGQKLNVHLASGGGFVISINPRKK